MAHISLAEANAWLEATKLTLSSVDDQIDQNAANIVIGRLRQTFTLTAPTWVDETTTPALVRTLISMYYVSYIYDRTYADDASDTSNYAFILRRNADTVINGLISGAVILTEDPTAADTFGQPAFFPNDASSANPASVDFPSDGPAAFTMGQVF
jgi:hypothetical protein